MDFDGPDFPHEGGPPGGFMGDGEDAFDRHYDYGSTYMGQPVKHRGAGAFQFKDWSYGGTMDTTARWAPTY